MAVLKTSLLILTAVLYLALIQNAEAVGKVVCFYNSKAYWRKNLAKVAVDEIKPALSMCNYLIYGFAGIDDDKYKAKSLDKDLDLEKGKNYFKAITELKKTYPGVKFLLSVGGFADSDKEKYLKALETSERRGKFVSSITQMAKDYNFDGIDLAWEFPIVKEKKERSTLGSIWHSVKKAVTPSKKDDKEKEHKDQFTLLCKELAAALRGENHRILTLSVMPHVNPAAYYDGPAIKDSVEHIHLMTYDFRNPDRTDLEADYSAPLHYVYDRVQDQNIEAQVKWWLEHGVPATKLIITIPTFGRTWKMTSDSGKSGQPPFKADGPGEAGPYLKEEGLMAYYEICPSLVSDSTAKAASTLLRRVNDPTFRQGTYAFRLPKDSSSKGLWVSFEHPEFAAKKAQYARTKGLGGVAIYDISLDDFKGSCDNTNTKFPILKAVKLNI